MEKKRYSFWTTSQLLEIRVDPSTKGVFFILYKRDDQGKLSGERVIVAPTYAELLAMIKASEVWVSGRSVESFINFCNKFTQVPNRNDGLYFIHEDKLFGLGVLKKKIRDRETGEVSEVVDKLGFVVRVSAKEGKETKKETYVFPLSNLELLRFSEIIKNEVLPVALQKEESSLKEAVRERRDQKRDLAEVEEEEPWFDEVEESTPKEVKKEVKKEKEAKKGIYFKPRR